MDKASTMQRLYRPEHAKVIGYAASGRVETLQQLLTMHKAAFVSCTPELVIKLI